MQVVAGLFLTLLLVSYSVRPTESARILAVVQLNAYSHWQMFEPLLKALAARGHEVDVVSHFPQKTPLQNYKDISVEGSLPNIMNNFTVELALQFSTMLPTLQFFWFHNMDVCKTVFDHPKVQNLIHSKEKYDLVITEIFAVDCAMAFGHKFKAPIVNVMTAVPYPWANERVANPDNPSYIPCYFGDYSAPMSFFERVYNTLLVETLKVGSYIFSDLRTDRLVSQYFGDDVPSVTQLQKNVSLVLFNGHFSITETRPLVPAMVEVAGLHINLGKKLPQDIKTFLDKSHQGVIYFSLGSLIQAETFPEETLKAFVEAFQELPQNILWKCNGDAIPGGLPAKIKAAKWMPQFDILGHRNTEVFITHGGMMGIQEAIHHGVPLLIIPFFGDQHHNAQYYKSRGMAELIDPRLPITKDIVLNALKKILTQPSYRENARRLSQLFHDRPQSALDTAVFWTEYVIRHRGAPHLRSAAVDLPLYQYLLLDVIAFLLLVPLVLLVILWFVFRKFMAVMGRKSKEKEHKNKTTKLKKK
ncbi:UDP-glycosyltransferase UGT5 [Anabrus simplex]|uniref:UDP-glycosyltransferase UGT5 n=1 Tax=Anabrus simplex TaxID=316456 RepID=UPI0035A2AD94